MRVKIRNRILGMPSLAVRSLCCTAAVQGWEDMNQPRAHVAYRSSGFESYQLGLRLDGMAR